MTASGTLTTKRFQRASEYALLVALHGFFLVAFHAFYFWWMAIVLGLSVFVMNFRLTMMREKRRTAAPRDRKRLIADTFESILMLCFVCSLSIGGVVKHWLAMADQEFLAYVAAMLLGLFLSAFYGELFWQSRNLRRLDDVARANYISNLRRTIIFPYLISRRKERQN